MYVAVCIRVVGLYRHLKKVDPHGVQPGVERRMLFGVGDVGCRVWGGWCRVRVFDLGVWGVEWRVWGVGFGV